MEDAQPLRPALSAAKSTLGEEQPSPRSGSTKVVSIAEPESTSSLQCLDDQPYKQHSAGVAKRMTGRPTLQPISSSRTSLFRQSGLDDTPASHKQSVHPGEAHAQGHRHHDRLFTQVSEWLQTEKAKSAARKSKKNHGTGERGPAATSEEVPYRPRGSSPTSNPNEASLEKLQKILEESMASFGYEQLPIEISADRRPSFAHGSRRKPSTRRLSRSASSDTEYQDGEVVVPTCDVMLDNSKTLGYGGGVDISSMDSAVTSKRAEKERRAWSSFKGEILRLAHTLRLKGWRRVPLDRGDDIGLERLCGALTNAVYVVSPPSNLAAWASTEGSAASNVYRRPPPKLLLRVYGPQVEHLIDREVELSILRRLARKKIGPRLLGTFRNGRFEEYFASETLTHDDLRNPETSKQIAKRMRELHDGIELLEQERDDGPFVWLNWDKWVERCERVVRFLDNQVLSARSDPSKSRVEAWKERGLVCGVEWPVFRGMVENYRRFLFDRYGSAGQLREKLVFAHNDTQYGNILRLTPSGESPLLLPANSHKQLIVIDFEYASANTPGLEFANHFTEWCYDYHDPLTSHACNTTDYPSLEEQRRFIRSYVNHRPQFSPRASATPKFTASPGPGSSISTFMLDSRTPGGVSCSYQEEEEARIKASEEEVEMLIQETRIWRVANSAQWVAWGILKAKIPELDELEDSADTTIAASDNTRYTTPSSSKLSDDPISSQVDHDQDRHSGSCAVGPIKSDGDVGAVMELEGEEGDDEFDYLSYARERALFFWGDVVSLGLCKLDELPQSLRDGIKIVKY